MDGECTALRGRIAPDRRLRRGAPDSSERLTTVRPDTALPFDFMGSWPAHEGDRSYPCAVDPTVLCGRRRNTTGTTADRQGA
ncbi:hypothetical protein SAMN05421773_13017 [Streptomyces aidingensis]|uniref:Uncharacterized protein n=1 Tax=Streptomyces aidingensis TaxID=910347 RepID=A0A1I1VCE0_9ACTN|nr:hypothetical protein SAMN05421773_13017 [Streptomyces aidingensis]